MEEQAMPEQPPFDARANDLDHWQTILISQDAEAVAQAVRGSTRALLSPRVVTQADRSTHEGAFDPGPPTATPWQWCSHETHCSDGEGEIDSVVCCAQTWFFREVNFVAGARRGEELFITTTQQRKEA
jgi:hypothetical protein